MSTPQHRTAPGSSYFVTTKCWQGRSVFQVRENVEVLIEPPKEDSKIKGAHPQAKVAKA